MIKILPSYEKIELIYRGSNDGFKFSDFERKFFKKKRNVLLIKSKEN